jgi:hypothetical protein
MFIYNVTTKVSPNVVAAWIKWMKEEHLPAIMATGCFGHYSFSRLLDMDEEDGPTFTVQFHAADKSKFDRYESDHAPSLRKASLEKWGQETLSFRSLMQHVN